MNDIQGCFRTGQSHKAQSEDWGAWKVEPSDDSTRPCWHCWRKCAIKRTTLNRRKFLGTTLAATAAVAQSGASGFSDFEAEKKGSGIKISYQGYLGYELCHPLPVIDGQTVGIEFAEENAQLAAEFMRGLIVSK